MLSINVYDSVSVSELKRLGKVYLVSDWGGLSAIDSDKGGVYILQNNLDLNTADYDTYASENANSGSGWQSLADTGDFTGVLDGNNHTIADVYNADYTTFLSALIESASGPLIRNLTISNYQIYSSDGALSNSFLVANLSGDFEINNVHVVNCLAGNGAYTLTIGRFGGLVGRTTGNGSISNCTVDFTASLSTSFASAGILGEVDTTGTVEVTGCESTVNFIDSASCSWFKTSAIVGAHEGGKLIISNSKASGDIISTGGNASVAGVLGFCDGDLDIRDTHSYVDISTPITGDGGGGFIGGFGTNVGSSTVYVSKCSVSAVLDFSSTGATGLGGFFGVANSTISLLDINGCYTLGSLDGDGQDYVGGFAGVCAYGGAGINNCFSAMSVIGSGYVGGFIGTLTGPLDKCYSVGVVTATGGTPTPSGFVPDSFDDGATITNCFWDTETSGYATSDGGTGKTTAQMKAIATFNDTATSGLDEEWNITNSKDLAYIWGIMSGENSGYPFLQFNSAGPVSVSDTANVTDTTTILIPTLLINAGDNISTAELLSSNINTNINVGDVVSLSESNTNTKVQINLIDFGDTGYSEVGAGWTTFSTAGGGINDNIRYISTGASGGDGSKSATWNFGVLSGVYLLEIHWTTHTNRSTDAPFSVTGYSSKAEVPSATAPIASINDAGSTITFDINERQDNTGATGSNDVNSGWLDLGDYTVDGGEFVVELTDDTSTGYIVADAVRITYISEIQQIGVVGGDNITVDESVSLMIPTLTLNVGDNISTLESATVFLPVLVLNVVDEVVASEGVEFNVQNYILVYDNVNLNDETELFIDVLYMSILEDVNVVEFTGFAIIDQDFVVLQTPDPATLVRRLRIVNG